MRFRYFWLITLAAVVLSTAGCGSFIAHRIVQAPNTYPTWFAPEAPVSLGFSPKLLTNFPVHFVEIGPPTARMRYRIVEPADYNLEVTATNWLQHGKQQYDFTFRADVPGASNIWTAAPRGTVVLLHGYGLAQFSMAPWALRLAQEGWRCVLVDLRGHGKSTGKRIYFGTRETHDLSQLLDQLARDGKAVGPVAAVGESYGASLALRWKGVDPRVGAVVAIAPYAVLSNAVLNITHEYSGWTSEAWKPWKTPFFIVGSVVGSDPVIKAGLRKVPSVLNVQPGEIDTATVLRQRPVDALFVAGADDKISPVGEVNKLYKVAAPGSELVVVPHATHEALTFFFKELAPPMLAWLDKQNGPQPTLGGNQQNAHAAARLGN